MEQKKNQTETIPKLAPPGFIVKLELKARGIKQMDFAKQIDILPSHLSEILRGKKPMSDSLAQKIGEALKIPSKTLIIMQAEYECQQKKEQFSTENEQKAAVWLERYEDIIDIRTIFNYLGLSKMSMSEKENFCKDKLHLNDASEYNRVSGFYHKSQKTGCDAKMISTWTILAKYEARQKERPNAQYSKTNLDKLADELVVVFNENRNTINRTERVLASYGITFCVVPKIEKASIDGFTFIEDGQPSIIVTKRYNRIDNFAFAVLHEVAHLKKHLKTDGEMISITDTESDIRDEEQEANQYAADKLIPGKVWESAPSVQMNPYIIQREYTKWAERNNLNKWIVLGRVSHETGMYRFKSDPTREIQ